MPDDSVKTGKILIVDDNEDLLKAARMFLKRNFKQVDIEKTPDSIPTLLKNENYDVILLDMNFTKDVSSGHEGFVWLERILEIDPSAVVILITAYGDVQMAVKAIKEGAMDFILKPWENERLLATVNSAMQLRKSKIEVNELKDKQTGPVTLFKDLSMATPEQLWLTSLKNTATFTMILTADKPETIMLKRHNFMKDLYKSLFTIN